MNARTALLAAVVAGALVWAASTELEWPVRLFAALLLGPAPVAFLAQARSVETLARPVPRLPIYLGSIVGLTLLGTTAYLAARFSGLSHETLGLVAMPASRFLAWTAALLIAALLIVALFRRLGVRESEIMREIVPDTASERAVFVVLCVAAGLGEEIAFRGVLLPAIGMATGSTMLAVMVSSLAFGVLHAHQNAGGAVRAAALGLLLALPLVLSGSVYASMAAHTLIDIVGGLWLARWLLR